MKKTIFLLCVLSLCVSAGVFAQSGVIRELSGTVELKAPGAQNYTAAKSGDRISKDTVISTGFRSTALVEVGHTVLTVRPLTRLTLTEISSSGGTESLNVNLRTGRVRVDVNPPAGMRASTAVTSPIATASVRGTSFEFDTMNLNVNEGTVAFAGNRGALMRVSAGSVSRINADGTAVDPIQAKLERYRPPAPIGAASSGTAAGESAASNGGVSFGFKYEETY